MTRHFCQIIEIVIVKFIEERKESLLTSTTFLFFISVKATILQFVQPFNFN